MGWRRLAAGTAVAAILGVAGGPAAGAGTSGTVETPALRGVDAAVQRGLEEKAYPGAVLIIGQPGRILWAKAYGRHTFEPDSRPMTLDTIFDLASVSKVVGTATVAMGLIEEGKLGLDDRVSSHLPIFGTGGKEEVTVRDLLTHVSGLKAYERPERAEANRRPGESTADAMIRRIAEMETEYTPRTKLVYSCLNAQIMARVNEIVSGRRMDDYLQEKVYGPLGMKDTLYRLDGARLERTAPTTRDEDGRTTPGEIHDPIARYHSPEEHCPGNAGLFSTAPDLARYCEMILLEGQAGGRQIFKPETVRLMTSLQTPEEVRDLRALGWDIYTTAPYCTRFNQTDETRVIGHTGFTGTLILLDKLSRTYAVFLTNRVWPDEPEPSARIVSRVRREIWDTVLRALPEYRSWFKETDGQGGRRGRGGSRRAERNNGPR